MKVKISTKEKFHVISVGEEILTANMAGELENTCLSFLENEIRNVIVNLADVKEIDLASAEVLLSLHQKFYDSSCSYVICCVNKEITKMLDENEFLEMLNITPSESEAWDMVQMEEIERELMEGE